MARGTKVRTVRVHDEVWEKAQAVAERQGTTVSALVVGFLETLRPYRNINWGKKGVMRSKTPRSGVAPKRAIRVDDELWADASSAARVNRVPLSALIVNYLERLRLDRHPNAAMPGAMPVPRPAKPRRRGGIDVNRAHAKDPATCPHTGGRTTIPYGTFCNDCGSKLILAGDR